MKVKQKKKEREKNKNKKETNERRAKVQREIRMILHERHGKKKRERERESGDKRERERQLKGAGQLVNVRSLYMQYVLANLKINKRQKMILSLKFSTINILISQRLCYQERKVCFFSSKRVHAHIFCCVQDSVLISRTDIIWKQKSNSRSEATQ